MKNNAQTWARLTRLDLQDLSISLGNAALEELRHWPANGEGRLIKEQTEKITRSLERAFDQNDNFTFDVLQDVADRLSHVAEIPFYREFLANKIYSNRKGDTSTYDVAISGSHRRVAGFVEAHRPPRAISRAARQEKLPPPPPSTIEDIGDPPLSEVVPTQQSAPLQFTVLNGKLQLKKQSAKSKAEDRKIISLGKVSLQDDSNTLLNSLRETNADPRLSLAVAGIRDTLASDADVIRLGMLSISCEAMCRKFSDQLSDIVSSQLEALSTNLSLFVAQFPECSGSLRMRARQPP